MLEVAGTAASFASFLSMAEAMALGNEMEKKRDAAQMSAAAVGFFLDREGHKKFLRTATNQELEAENTRIRAMNMELGEAVNIYYDSKVDAERELQRTEDDLRAVRVQRDFFKKVSVEQFDKRCEAEEEKRALELRIQKAIRKALHPDMPDTEDEKEATSPEAPSTPSERASTIEPDALLFGDPFYKVDGGND